MSFADDSPPVINEDADRILGRIILRHGALCFLLLLVSPFVMWFVNFPGSPLYAERRFLDTLAVLIILLPFFVGTNRLFAARLSIGRSLTQDGRFAEAVAALDPFAGPTQRFLDSSGEAHFWLAQAYAGTGEREKADAARQFLRRHRPGIWAEKLGGPQENKTASANRRRGKNRRANRRGEHRKNLWTSPNATRHAWESNISFV